MHALCPNCQQRPEDTAVDYDEVVRSSYRVRRSREWRSVRVTRSFSSTSAYGQTRLCAVCATRYRRMVQWRTLGWKMANRGLIALMLSGVFFSLVVATTALKDSWLAYASGGVVALAIFAMLVGCLLIIAARIMRPSAIRFLSRMAPNGAASVATRQYSQQ
jgi:uncharacterized membrane protein YraQ (UPF0718 family)